MAYVGKIFINLEESERENKSIKVAEVSILSMCSGEQFCVRSCVCVCFKVWLFIQDVAFCNFLYITFLSLRYNFVFFLMNISLSNDLNLQNLGQIIWYHY